jgi:hypothetical protein
MRGKPRCLFLLFSAQLDKLALKYQNLFSGCPVVFVGAVATAHFRHGSEDNRFILCDEPWRHALLFCDRAGILVSPFWGDERLNRAAERDLVD